MPCKLCYNLTSWHSKLTFMCITLSFVFQYMFKFVCRGVMDESGEQFVAYCLPTEDTIQKRRRDITEGIPYMDGDTYEYKMAREYNWNVKSKASKGYEENYFLVRPHFFLYIFVQSFLCMWFLPKFLYILYIIPSIYNLSYFKAKYIKTLLSMICFSISLYGYILNNYITGGP